VMANPTKNLGVASSLDMEGKLGTQLGSDVIHRNARLRSAAELAHRTKVSHQPSYEHLYMNTFT
jgi:hypothetical protein